MTQKTNSGLTTDFVTDPVQPVDREEPQDVIVADLTRVLTPTQAAREWDRVTRKPSHALVDLPADLEG